jgi:hypothetical protein
VDQLLARVHADYPAFAPLVAARNAYHTFITNGGTLQNIAEESTAIPGTTPNRAKNNPWGSGTFYLLLFVVVMATLVTAANYVEWYLFPALLIAALLVVPLIGVLQAFNDGTLSEKGFLRVLLESYRRLPLLRGKGGG